MIKLGKLHGYNSITVSRPSSGYALCKLATPHSFDQTEHIRETILDPFFDDKTERVKGASAPFDTARSYEQALNETLPATPEELRDLERRYKGPFNHHLGKMNYIKEWSRPDLMYSCNRLGSWCVAPNEPAFAGIKHQHRYLARVPHRPFMYPRGVQIHGDHKLSHGFSIDDVDDATITNHLAAFADGGEGRSLNDRRSIACVILALLGVAIHWKGVTQPAVSAHSTDSEVRTFYVATKLVQNIRPILKHLGIKITAATKIYEDSQPTIDIVRANHLTTRVKHIAVPIAYIHEQYVLLTVDPQKIDGKLQPADIGTKALPGPQVDNHFDYMRGARFLPPPGTEHYKLLDLHLQDVQYRPEGISKD